MDPLSVTATASVVQILDLIWRVQAYNRNEISHSYGVIAGVLISICFPKTASEYERLQRVVLRGSDEDTLRFRDAVTNECSMTAVAVRLIFFDQIDPVYP